MRILHLEDNLTDAELVAEIVRDEWPDCLIEVVSSAAQFQAALHVGGHDLVISDFSLPDFSGIDALHLVRQVSPQLPFIFVSGNIGEERAIEAVHQGAQDYVLKDRLKRLPSAIHRTLRDAQERQRFQAAEAERQRLAAIIEATPDFVGVASPDGAVVYLNTAARHMVGLGDDPLRAGLRITDFHPREVADAAARHLEAAARAGQWSGESALAGQDGRVIPVSQVLLAHRGEAGELTHFSSVMRDLTGQKRIESSIQNQKEILEMIVSGLPLPEVLDQLLRFVESQAEELIATAYVVEEDAPFMRQVAGGRLPPTLREATACVAIADNTGSCGTAAWRRQPVFVADIATDPVWANYRDIALAHNLRACWSTPIFDHDQRLLGTFSVYSHAPGLPTPRQLRLIGTATHIAAICFSRHRLDRELRTQADILNKARDAIIEFDLAHRVTYWNHAAERIFGWSAAEIGEKRGAGAASASAGDPLAPLCAALRQGEEWHGEIQIQNREGRPLVIECRASRVVGPSGEARGWLVIGTDITDRKRVEEQFLRAQRLESIGMLAAGIAHDLNNVLAPMLLAAPMLRDHLTEPTDLSVIDALEKSAERGSLLVKQILSFAHGAEGAHSIIQVKHLLRDLVGFMEQTFTKAIAIEEQIPRDLWTINANPTQIHQVLLNLCVNARDAMPHGGRLILAAENQVLDEVSATAIEGGRAGSFLVLRVEDTGTGMPPEVLARIWEPFYTTKGVGKGTGLGLSTVRGIVANHSGFMSVESVIGRGTVFRVYLPAADPHVAVAAPLATEALPPPGRGELILVVDDEVNVRQMTSTLLARHGYRVLTASDGSEAVALFASRVKQIDLVITDYGMPHLDGAALSAVLRRLRPDIRILMSSGLAGDAHDGPVLGSKAPFLLKPFRSETLLIAVDRLLHSPPGR